jgi:hypothetical protein
MDLPFRSLLPRLPFFFAAAIALAGCSQRAGVDEAIEKQLVETKGSQIGVARFSGTVTIDHETPSIPRKRALVLILYSAKDAQPGHETLFYTACDKEGHFEFTRYSKGDGVPPGSYTVLFAELMPRRRSQFSGPDDLKNLYNDPDTSPFHVDIAPPGKADWDFNLDVAGKEPNTHPGPHAIKQLVTR